MTTRILFICMGNICRSPLAECMFRDLAGVRGVEDRFEIDSAGTTSYHVGDPPDQRVRAVAKRNGLVVDGAARQVHERDFETFDHLICMDEDNREQILARGAPQEKVRLLLEIDPNTPMAEVPDPYYGEGDGFELVHRLVKSACAALLDELLADETARRS